MPADGLPVSAKLTVARTLLLSNDSLLPGNPRAPSAGHPAQEAFDAANGLVYAADSGSNGVLVFSPDTGVFLPEIAVNASPAFLAVDPINGQLYFDNSSGGFVEAINVTSGAVSAWVPVGSAPRSILFDPADGAMVVASSGSNELTFLNATTNRLIGNVSAPGGPWGVAFDTADSELYVTDSAAGNSSWSYNCTGEVSSYNGSGTFAHLRDYWVGYGATGIAYDPANGDLYVANSYLCGVSVLDPSSGNVTATIPAPSAELLGILIPWFVTVDPTTDRVFVTVTEFYQGLTGYVMAIDGATNRVLADIPVGSKVMDVVDDPGLGQVLISDPLAMSIEALGTSSLLVQGQYFSGTEPGQLLLDPENGLLYVLDPPSRTVFVVDPRTDRVVDRIDVGEFADSLALDPATGNVFVSLYYESAIVVINRSTESASQQVFDAERNGYTGDNPESVTVDAASGQFFSAEAFPEGFGSNGSTYWHGFVDARSVATGDLRATVELGGYPVGPSLTLDPAGVQLYVPVSNSNGTGIAVVDTRHLRQESYANVTGTVDPRWTLGSDGILYNPGNDLVYLEDSAGSSTTILDPRSNLTVVGRLSIPSPTAMTYDPSRGTVDLTSRNGTVTILNGSTSRVAAVVPVGQLPDGVAVDSATNQLFVANNESGSLSIIDLGPASAPLGLTLSVTPGNVSFGSTVTVTANATGGSGLVGFRYTGLPPGCAGANSSTFTCRPGENGTFAVQVEATTQFDQSASASAKFTVLRPVYPVTFEESGLPPGSEWYVSPLGGPATPSTNSSVAFQLANGSYPFVVGNVPGYRLSSSEWPAVQVAGAPVTVQVAYQSTIPPPAFELLLLAVIPAQTRVGESLTIEAVAANATGPVNYTYSGLPPGCVPANATSISCVPSTAGTYAISLVATDSAGHRANASSTLSVLPAAPTSSANPWGLALAAVGFGLAIALAVALVVLWRRGRSGPSAS